MVNQNILMIEPHNFSHKAPPYLEKFEIVPNLDKPEPKRSETANYTN